MEQVIREASQGQGIVVYVSPTKALVNQVEADIYARFEKSYTKKSISRTLHGVFTKEYRHNVHDAQILITVPECLELVIMMALNGKTAGRIRWVIFDEVHCISKANGAVWERLLIGTKAPWVALSATIGNPKEFHGWLEGVEKAKGHDCKLVQVDQRVNDLSINVFDSSIGTLDERAMDRIVPINPLGVLSIPLIQGHGGIPSQTKFLPEHVWEISHKLQPLADEVDDEEFRALVRELDFSKIHNATAVTMVRSNELEQKCKIAIGSVPKLRSYKTTW
jgi:hypothetical protein